jgi:hypothetical protein
MAWTCVIESQSRKITELKHVGSKKRGASIMRGDFYNDGLQHIVSERVLFDWMISSNRNAL